MISWPGFSFLDTSQLLRKAKSSNPKSKNCDSRFFGAFRRIYEGKTKMKRILSHRLATRSYKDSYEERYLCLHRSSMFIKRVWIEMF